MGHRKEFLDAVHMVEDAFLSGAEVALVVTDEARRLSLPCYLVAMSMPEVKRHHWKDKGGSSGSEMVRVAWEMEVNCRTCGEPKIERKGTKGGKD